MVAPDVMLHCTSHFVFQYAPDNDIGSRTLFVVPVKSVEHTRDVDRCTTKTRVSTRNITYKLSAVTRNSRSRMFVTVVK